MKREEFMEQLRYLLQDIPVQEMEDAVDYYENYFDEAGVDQEEAVIEELESPEKVAAIIRDSIKGEEGTGSYTEEGYENERYRQEEQVPKKKESSGRFHFRGNHNRNLILFIFIIIGALTIALPGIAGVGGAALGLIGGLFGILLGIFGMMAGLIFGGGAVVVYAVVRFFTNVPEGLLFLGGGLIIIAFGILACMLFIWLVKDVLPRIIRWIVKVVRSIVGKEDQA